MHSKAIIIWRQIRNLGRLPADWLKSRKFARQHTELFEQQRSFVFFVGYSRSGHSAVAAILDAHPEAVIADELGVLRYLHAGFSREQIQALCYLNSQASALTGRRSGSYRYPVREEWQGRHQSLRLLGDKQAEGETLRLDARPRLLKQLRRKMGARLKIIHMTRNPFDNVASMARHAGGQNKLTDSIERYFSLCEALESIRNQAESGEFYEIRHESMLANPANSIMDLLQFLELPVPEGFIESCCELLLPHPNRSRHNLEWSSLQRQRVEAGIAKHRFLAGYTFDEA